MWRSIFLHEFPDQDIRHFQAVDGDLDATSFSLTPTPISNPGQNSIQIAPGSGFRYWLQDPQNEVIGVSIRVRLRYPIQVITGPVRLVTLGNDIALEIEPISAPLFDGPLAAAANARLKLGTNHHDIGTLIFAHRDFTTIRVDWHTSGQVRLSQDNVLAGYRHSVAPASQFEFDVLEFGLPDIPVSTNPRYQVTYVFVRALRRQDPLDNFSRLLPDFEKPDDQLLERCQVLATVRLLRMADQMRALMSQFHALTSKNWNAQGGLVSGPIDSVSRIAHKNAVAAVGALTTMLRTNDFSNPDDFLAPFTKFVTIIHDTIPSEFESLAAKLDVDATLPCECREAFQKAGEQWLHDLRPLIELLGAAANTIKTIVGGQ